ncbi:class I SAM-dependent methyltransferase [Streptomyces misionensis]|uniref:class I SAM-dependent methyltransferase n=1 Tax=Streptomyces misionensis TaxID=67331 RepID=UPI0021BD9D1D|nr:class I SAM-dependent methyltransferase [Streptomyces misionensis]
MTRPDQSASVAISDDALFGPETDDYARYRPGLPDAAVHLLAATQHGVPDPGLLDLGTGTGQVPRALLPVLHQLAHIDLVDVNQRMLETALTALEPVSGACTVNAFIRRSAHLHPYHARSSTQLDHLLPVLPLDVPPGGPGHGGPDGRATRRRGDHGRRQPMDPRSGLDRRPSGTDPGLLGEDRRAGTRGTYSGPGRSYEEDLDDSAFSDVAEHRFPVARARTPEDVLGYLHTTSFTRPALFAGRHQEFEAEALHLLRDHARGGVLKEDAVFTVLLARRPGGDA